MLKEYKAKRNFKETPEPAGKKIAPGKILRFVVQRHNATRLHYDFRLELDGVLKSWAVPKGPSMNPADKRLAVQVEDHPVDYIAFQGSIPEGNYGAGQVQVWDSGHYIPVDAQSNPLSNKEALQWLEKKGELKFLLKGDKLNGEFVLVRLKDQKNWLLIKHRDEYAVNKKYDSEKLSEPFDENKLTDTWEDGGTKTQKKAAAKKTTTKKAAPKKAASAVKKTAPGKVAAAGKKKVQPASVVTEKYEDFYVPMMATPFEKPFDSDEWVFEIKWDGYRAIGEWQQGQLRFYSRNGISFERRYPVVAEALTQLKRAVVLDGEVVVLDENGQPSFQKLQHYEDNKHLPIQYYVFDLLFLDGKDLRELPLTERKALLQKVLPKNSPIIHYCEHVAGTGNDFFAAATANNLEGMIAKKADSEYTCGARSPQWLKIKSHKTREAVIIGYTDPRGSRKYFGALLLAEYQGKQLKYLGNMGTGFTEKTLKSVWNTMQPLITNKSPFEERIVASAPITWLRPLLVCQLKYTEQTEEGMLRHPVFLGLRDDKTAPDVQSNSELPPPSKATSPRPSTSTTATMAKIGGHEVPITHPDKIYWPKEKITKGDMIAYYDSMASYILPYLKKRPMSLKRNPNGINDPGFYHKDAGEEAPEWVDSAPMYSESAKKTVDYIVCNNKATLIYLANLGCIEMNPWNSTVLKPENPSYFVIDIDPSDKNTFDQVIETAQAVLEVLNKAGAVSYCKTSGASGLHIYVPLNSKYTYDEAKEFAHIIAELTHELVPDFTSLERNLKKRGNKIYIDYLQNRIGQTLAAAYSLRPRPGATVSTPLTWKEVKKGLHPSQFTIYNIEKRVNKLGDLFYMVLQKGINIQQCLKKLGY